MHLSPGLQVTTSGRVRCGTCGNERGMHVNPKGTGACMHGLAFEEYHDVEACQSMDQLRHLVLQIPVNKSYSYFTIVGKHYIYRNSVYQPHMNL